MKTIREVYKQRYLALFVLLLTQFIPASSIGQKFTLAIFGDTQGEVTVNPQMFFSQLNWIRAKRDSLNIPMALHVGDITNFDNYNQWEIASKGFEILDDANIPYALATGNHDTHAVGKHSGSAAPGNVNANLRNTDKFNAYFPVSRLTAQRGRFEPGKSDNAYYTFRADGLNWLVLSLEFCARRGPVNWAEEVVADHPSYNVIVLTHYFLNSNGTVGQRNAGYGDLSPQQIDDLLIKTYPNIIMVVSGHVDSSAHHIDTGIHGNKIYEILQDYQGKGHDYGGGYLRLISIDPDAGTISAKMYSPYYDKTKGGTSTFSFSNAKFIRGFPKD
jgi:hypothetical protein